jgi:hypothetical protein
MIRIERDPLFWTTVAAHPSVAPMLQGADPALIGALAARREFLPIAAEHGGFLLQRRDDLGFAWELHTLFTPEGWGAGGGCRGHRGPGPDVRVQRVPDLDLRGAGQPTQPAVEGLRFRAGG